MPTTPAILNRVAFPPRTGRAGSDVFNAVVAIVRNRTGSNFAFTFNSVLRGNRDLMERGYDNLDTAQNFGLLLNRVESGTGLSAVTSCEMAAAQVSALANRFVPALALAPVATQYDVMWRAALQLEREEGFVERVINRRSADPAVPAGDWKAASDRAEDVFFFIDEDKTEIKDFGTSETFQGMTPRSKRVSLGSMLDLMMSERGLTRRQAFDTLKEEQPIFWAYAILSFEPDKQ
jgi:hypothetical protein